MAAKLSPPYPIIRDAFKRGRVIPFLGAGASFGNRNPSETQWRAKAGEEWQVAFLPTATELARYLAGRSQFPEGESSELTKVAQYYLGVGGRDDLSATLHDVFSFSQEPGAIHRYLADAAKSAPLLIVTTNYDDLLERAFDAGGPAYDVVVHATNLESGVLWWPHGSAEPQQVLAKDLDIDLASRAVIYKIHGAIDRHSFGASRNTRDRSAGVERRPM